MGSNWWTRLFSRSAATRTVGAGPALAEDVPHDVTVALAAPAEPAPERRLEWREPERPAADPPPLANSASLGRSMALRVRLLLDGADPEALHSDGPALVEMLLEGGGSFVGHLPEDKRAALDVARRPGSGVGELVPLFAHDPALAQAVIRLANSPAYRHHGEPMVALHGAVHRLGRTTVQGVLMASMVEGLLCLPGGAFDLLVGRTWSHMQRTAPIARDVAPVFGVDPDAAFSFALLHDVGKLVIFDHAATLRREQQRDLRIPEPFFRQLLWQLHEPVGGLAMLRWGMGGEAAHVVGGHHRRPVPETADPATEAVFVAEAVELAHCNHAALAWEEWWERGGITADRFEVAERIRAAEEA